MNKNKGNRGRACRFIFLGSLTLLCSCDPTYYVEFVQFLPLSDRLKLSATEVQMLQSQGRQTFSVTCDGITVRPVSGMNLAHTVGIVVLIRNESDATVAVRPMNLRILYAPGWFWNDEKSAIAKEWFAGNRSGEVMPIRRIRIEPGTEREVECSWFLPDLSKEFFFDLTLELEETGAAHSYRFQCQTSKGLI